LNPAFGPIVLYPATFVDESGIPLSMKELGLVNDYVRNLASHYFNDPQSTYLFTNIVEMKTNVVANMQNVIGALKTLMVALDKNIGTSGLLSTDLDGKFTSNAETTTNNLCRNIFLSIIQQVPTRFTGFSAMLAPMPFEAGDIISFDVMVGNANVLMPTILYTVDLVLVAVPVNVAYDSLAADYQ
jgi:hypothetical protein